MEETLHTLPYFCRSNLHLLFKLAFQKPHGMTILLSKGLSRSGSSKLRHIGLRSLCRLVSNNVLLLGTDQNVSKMVIGGITEIGLCVTHRPTDQNPVGDSLSIQKKTLTQLSVPRRKE